MRLRKGFWVYLPVAIFAWFAPVTAVKADVLGNWTYSQTCTTSGSVEVINNSIVLHGPDGNGCSGQSHWVQIQTTIPAGVNTVDFTWTYQTYDGAYYDPPQYAVNGAYVQLTQLNNDTGSLSIPVQENDVFIFRQYSVDTCCQPGNLTISNLSLWTTSSTTSTTTTTTSTTTIPQTTTTESTTTTSSAPETTTSVPETTTTTTSTYPPQTVPVTLFLPSTTVDVPEETTTTTVEEPTTTVVPQEETTTTTEPRTIATGTSPDNTVETTTSTIALNLEPNLVPLTSEEVTAVVEQLSAITEITPEVLSAVVDALNSGNITDEQVQQIVDAVVENLDTITELTPEVLNQVLDILESDSVTQDQVQSIVDSVLATDISSDQATQLATSAAVLENITGDQATEVFASIDESSITDTQAAAIVEALVNAPAEVKQAFEAQINVFQGGFDNYIPTGSVISVGSRRVVVAVTTVSFVLPAPVVSRRKQRV
jgi:hypothetical protein